MADIIINHVTGRRVGVVFTREDGQRWNTSGSPAFQAHVDGNFAQYKVAGTEIGTSGDYKVTVPNTGQRRLSWCAYDIADAGGTLALNDSKIAAALWVAQLYHALIDFTRDQGDAQDEYTVRWFRDGELLTSGITSAQLQVVKRSDGTDLVAATNLMAIGATGALKLDVTNINQRVSPGEAALVTVTATIDGATRTFARIIGRDL